MSPVLTRHVSAKYTSIRISNHSDKYMYTVHGNCTASTRLPPPPLSHLQQTTITRLTDLALVRRKHERRLQAIGQRGKLVTSKHVLDKRENPLGHHRVGEDGEGDARGLRPHQELEAVRAPEEEDALGELCHTSDLSYRRDPSEQMGVGSEAGRGRSVLRGAHTRSVPRGVCAARRAVRS